MTKVSTKNQIKSNKNPITDSNKITIKSMYNIINNEKRLLELEQEIKDKPEKLKEEIIKWICEHLGINQEQDMKNGILYFITLRYSGENKPEDYEKARKYLRDILKPVYEKIYGRRRWIKFLPKSITVIEKGKRNHLHSHTIVNINRDHLAYIHTGFISAMLYHPELLISYKMWLFDETRKEHKNQCYVPKKNDVVVEPIRKSLKDLHRVIEYVLKEYNFKKNKIDFSNFSNEQMLFRVKDK